MADINELQWIVNGFLEWHEGGPCPEGLIERARAAVPPSLLDVQKHQPCGCVICTCEDEERCHGCGAKFCAEHDPRGVLASDGKTITPAAAAEGGDHD